MVLGWLFVPIYMKAKVYTMPQYIKMRYGGERIRVYLTCLALLLSIFTKISVDLYSGAVFLQQALNWNLYASVIALILLAAFLTVGGKQNKRRRFLSNQAIQFFYLGGLTAMIWTDFIQTVIMVLSAFILMIISRSFLAMKIIYDNSEISRFCQGGRNATSSRSFSLCYFLDNIA